MSLSVWWFVERVTKVGSERRKERKDRTALYEADDDEDNERTEGKPTS